ncbi:phage tail assembly chaperone [Paracoccus versutus]|uniref:Tail assembly chaperone n=1 Tax=Paracoccus versutus TaxID=34007 RepID=A0A3D9XGP7_PARVE|nr:phage tail assembly chaperone [Paracoccus versutus]REF69650.1 tail assembly chaperone [Paracoccus versutus]WGR57978.1 phage tail assembly chaperone [Paracoccus versutus]SFY21239.1 Phage tail assembly chaperone protein, TAC [Paracoccus pantotrophus]
MFKTATAKHGLGWTPSEFWAATPRELWAAIEAAEEEAKAIKAARNQA